MTRSRATGAPAVHLLIIGMLAFAGCDQTKVSVPAGGGGDAAAGAAGPGGGGGGGAGPEGPGGSGGASGLGGNVAVGTAGESGHGGASGAGGTGLACDDPPGAVVDVASWSCRAPFSDTRCRSYDEERSPPCSNRERTFAGQIGGRLVTYFSAPTLGGLYCVYDPATGDLVGEIVWSDTNDYCCDQAFSIEKGEIDRQLFAAAGGAATSCSSPGVVAGSASAFASDATGPPGKRRLGR